jgi:catechol 2,3-dioxygenase-like lactoylglutathione lyase family enzyme
MSIRRAVPNIASDKLDACRDFYAGLLGFRVAMDLGWILTFGSPSNPTAQLSVLRQDATAPVIAQVTVEVAGVDAVYAQALRRGLELVYPLTDEPWECGASCHGSQRGGAEPGQPRWRRRDILTAKAIPWQRGGATPKGSEAACQGCLVPARSSSIVLSTRR